MCGIIGYIGPKQVTEVLLDGLKHLEYRGYDSAGIAIVDSNNQLQIRRASGKLFNLTEVVRNNPLNGTYGIGHTRWATHGRPTEENAHPHCDDSGRIVVVHNGIIENYINLKRELQLEGHVFATQTDTEVVAHLIGKYRKGVSSLEEAVRLAVKCLQGVYALTVLSADELDKIIAVRMGPPIIIGAGEDEYFVTSDVPAVLNYTRKVCFLGDGEIATLSKSSGISITDFEDNQVTPVFQHISWDPIMAEKGGFKHFMLKEIYEQPLAIRETLDGRVSLDDGCIYLDEININSDIGKQFTNLKIIACGTSWHAALVGKYIIEELVRFPVEVDYASEFRYRSPILDKKNLVIAITQSGETADTLAAAREAKRHGATVIAICNVQGSMITREANGTILTHAGPEIGVASTKAFTSQITALYLFALFLSQLRQTIDIESAIQHVIHLNKIPIKIESLLHQDAAINELSRELSRAQDFLYLGRGVHFPIALEGALKLKEISYIHAEGFPAGEMKHGPNALISEQLPVVFVAPVERGNKLSEIRYEKTLSNMEEVKARDGKVIAVLTEGDTIATQIVDHVISIPETSDLLSPILSVIPLQLLAYHIAVRRGCDVDQPRNLAKSVTVE